MLLVRLARPLPGAFPRKLNDQLAQRHLSLVVGGLRSGSGPAGDRTTTRCPVPQ